MSPDPLSIVCPDCLVPAGQPCFDKRGPRTRPHDHRFIQLAPHPAKEIACACGAQIGELCINLRCKSKRNSNYHDDRDRAAYAAEVGTVVPGLVYPNGAPVRRPWCGPDRIRKSDGAHSLRVRVPGAFNPMFWVTTFDQKLWYGHLWKDKSQKAAIKARESIVDAVAAIGKTGATVWDKEVMDTYGPHPPYEDQEDPGEAHWGDCDHSPCTGH